MKEQGVSTFRTLAVQGVAALVMLGTWSPALGFNWEWDQGHNTSCDSQDPNVPSTPMDPPNGQCCDGQGSPVFVGNGEYTLTVLDLGIPGRVSLSANRYYSSRDEHLGLLGRGWTFEYELRLLPRKTTAGRDVVLLIPGSQRLVFPRSADGTFSLPIASNSPVVPRSLVQQAAGPYELSTDDGRVYTFSAGGDLLSITDLNGNSTTLSYLDGCLATVDLPGASAISINKGPDGRIESISDIAGRTIGYGYDGSGNLVSVTDPAGGVTTYDYDANNRLIRIKDPVGVIAQEMSYDADGRLISHIELGVLHTYEYLQNNRTRKVDAFGNTWEYVYDEHGLILQETNPAGHTRSRSYNSLGEVVSETDWNGNTTMREYDQLGRPIRVVDALGNETVFEYDPALGEINKEIDPLGSVTEYQHDSVGNVIASTVVAGTTEAATTTFEHDSAGSVMAVVDAEGNRTEFTYDGEGRVLSVTEPRGGITQFLRDAVGNVIQETDANSHTTSYERDLQGQVTKVTDPLGNTTEFSYDAGGNLISETNALGATTEYEYDSHNRLLSVTDPLGSTVSRAYNAAGLLASETDALGRVIYYKYDVLGRLIKQIHKVGDTGDLIDADDVVTTFSYDANGNVVEEVAPDGGVTTHVYDALDRLVATTDAMGRVSTQTYDPAGRIVQVSSPDGAVVTRTLDARGNLIQLQDQLGIIETRQYDRLGDVISSTNGAGETSVFEYEIGSSEFDVRQRSRILSVEGVNPTFRSQDLLSKVRFPDGAETHYEYDARGNRTASVEPSGARTEFVYDSANRLTSVKDPLGHVTAYTYNPEGETTTITDENGNTTGFEYDAAGRLITETYADGTTVRYTYDAVGNRVTRTDQANHATVYQYDDLNRLVQRHYPNGQSDTLSYDKADRIVSASGSFGTVVQEWDLIGRLTQSTQNGRVAAFTYDNMNHVRETAYPQAQVVRHAWDTRGRLMTIEDGAGVALAHYSYDAANRLSHRTYHNGVGLSASYDLRGNVVDVSHSEGVTEIAGFALTRDANGVVSLSRNRVRPAESESYTYDSAQRLAMMSRGIANGSGAIPIPVRQISYSLDPAGNWVARTVDGKAEGRTVNEMNEYVTINSVAQAYGASGNLTNDGSRAYAYDFENHLISVSANSSTAALAEYEYDALGRRIATTTSEGRVDFVYDDEDRVIQEFRDGALDATYVFGEGPNEVVRMQARNTTVFYGETFLGNVDHLTDEAGQVVEHYLYDPYGETRVFDSAGADLGSLSSTGNPYLFNGQRQDVLADLYDYRARELSTSQGRFAQRDPLLFVDGGNLYEYVNGDPINRTDPTGTCQNGGGDSSCHPSSTGASYQINHNNNTCCTRSCTQEHEQVHVANDGPCCERFGSAYKKAKTRKDQNALIDKFNRWLIDPGRLNWDECQAYTNDVKCGKKLKGQKKCDTCSKNPKSKAEKDRKKCCADIEAYINTYAAEAKARCANASKTPARCPFK